MVSVLDRITGSATKALLRSGRVVAVEDPSERFRSIRVAPDRPAAWAVGQKLQFQVRGMQFRTYTPHAWDGDAASFLVFRHGTGDAERWLSLLAVGSEVVFFGPRGAVTLDEAPPVFVGDETSFALTAAWQQQFGGVPAAQLYEVDDAVRTHPVAPIVLTGQAQSIAAVRKALEAAGLTPATKAKAHWDPRRTGLD